MSSLLPEGETMRNAVKWISGHLQDNPDQVLQKLVNDAIMRFDLSPKDADFLIRFYRKREAGEDTP